jgi:tetratricopeptide (TPR) repeat protein
VVRYYVFDQVSDAKSPVVSLAGQDAPLHYGVQPGPGEPEDNPRRVGGRIAGRTAVQLNRGIYSATQFPVENKSFTVEAWVRTQGPGDIKGDAPEESGTLLSQGIGFWDGWRITITYPARTWGLEIGKRPGAYSIRTPGPVADNLWHHIVATWDGRQACLYVDGMKTVAGEYTGDYVKPDPNAPFRVGFAGFGWGSVIADYDEVVIYRRALSSLEVVQHTLYYAPLAKDAGDRLMAADARLAGGDLGGAKGEYLALLKQPGLHPHWAAAIRLRLAQVLMQQQAYPEAVREYAAVMDVADLPEGLQNSALTPLVQLALQPGEMPAGILELLEKRVSTLSPAEQVALRLNLARSLAQNGKPEAALQTYKAVLAMPDLKPHEKLEIMLQMGHSFAAARQLAQARAAYAQVAASAGAPASYRSYAMLCVARTYEREKQWAAARAEYEKVVALPEVPEVHRWEAAEGLREVNREEKGLPGPDPAASRVALPKAPAVGAQLYVSPTGSDSGTGTKEKPFATLQRARDAVREIIRQRRPPGSIVVNLARGEYRLGESFALGAPDSGTKDSPVVWRAQEKGKVILSAGRALSGFKPVTDPGTLSRLPEEARGKVMQVDLKALGITDYGQLKPRGFSHGGGSPALELFCDGQPLAPARWPNDGFARVRAVVSNDAGGAVFSYDGDRPSRWQQAKDAWIFGYWKWQWADSRDPVLALDTTAHTLRLPQVTYGGIDPGAPYFIYNLLEEIDQPGEWYLDRAAGVLYLYPTTDPTRSDLRVSLLPTAMVAMDGASWVTLAGLTLEYGQAEGVTIKDGEHCLVAGCTIRNVAGEAVIIDGGSRHGILSCDLYNLGRGGSHITGGDRKTLTPGGHFMENCDVHHFSRVDRTYTPAVLMDGCGNRIAHNRFHHSPCHSMRIEGNDHVIEFNEIHEMVRESDDQGGLDMFANPAYRGVVIRYNFWHDIGTPYPTPCGQAGVRLDDAISGVLIYGNVFYRCSNGLFGAVQLHGGKEDVICNNIFADCKYGISFSGWGEARWKQFLDSDWVKQKLHQEVDISQPPYSTRYPALAHLYENEGVHQVWRNVAYNCGEFLTRDRGIQDLMDNTVTLKDPGFVNAAGLDFSLKADSPLRQMPGFRPIPFQEIGLYEDGLRGPVASPSGPQIR